MRSTSLPKGCVRALILAALLVSWLTACPKPALTAELPKLGAAIEQTSVSGLSSGAYMAGQMQLAHSRIVIGAGIIAGGPYGCAESTFADSIPGPGAIFFNASKAVNGCMLDGLRMLGIPDPVQLARRAAQLAENGRIDPIAGVLGDKIYLYSGREDHTVVPSIVAKAVELYVALGVPKGAIKHVDTVASGHGFVTATHGTACGKTGPPYVLACDYDQAGDLVRHLLGPLQPPAADAGHALDEFEQLPFVHGIGEHGLATTGLVYVPPDCRRAPGCRIHVVFHGCGQARNGPGPGVPSEIGYIPWAASNRLILLFPQVAPSALNPQGCWDWWGYTGRDYLTRNGAQVMAVHRMLLQLSER
jgi:poly(3-hydroxybutyrate) depolymerase